MGREQKKRHQPFHANDIDNDGKSHKRMNNKGRKISVNEEARKKWRKARP